jgi:hypothetical protein
MELRMLLNWAAVKYPLRDCVMPSVDSRWGPVADLVNGTKNFPTP